MKFFRFVVALCLMCAVTVGWSAESVQTAASVKQTLVQALVKDGVITDTVGTQVQQKYITEADTKLVMQTNEEGFIARNASWSNFIKLVGILLLLVAFNGIIRNIIKGLWHIITQVPMIVYQGIALGAGITGLLRPEMLWASQSYYVAIFCAFFNILIVGWIVVTYETIVEKLLKLFTIFKLSPELYISLLGCIYFSTLAIAYQSQVFGFFAAVCFSGMLSFGLTYFPEWGVLSFNVNEKFIGTAILGHIMGLLAYTYALYHGVPNIEYFKVGAQYYCSIALGVALLIAASPFYKKKSALFYAQVFTVVVLAAVAGYYYLGLEGIGTILTCIYVLFLLEWLAYIGYQAGLIIGCMTVGSSLFGLGMAFEHVGRLLVFSVK